MIYVSLLLISIVITLWLCVYSWHRRFTPGLTAFSVMLGFGTAWLAVITLMLTSPSREMALIWYRAGFVCVSAVPVLLLVFIAQYSGSRFITPVRMIFLFIVPLITQIVVWTDDRFHFFFKSIDIMDKNGLMVIESWAAGPWFISHSLYSFTVMTAALGWLVVYAVSQFKVFRGQSVGFILGSLMVILPNLAFAVGLIPPDVIVLPFGFLFMGLFFAWAIFRHKLFEVVPVARNKMVDIMSDGMIVFDKDNRVVDMNPAAKNALLLIDKDVVGQSLKQVFAPWPDVAERFSDADRNRAEICMSSDNVESYYDVRITSLVDKANRHAGRLILFRDTTERKNIERVKDRLLSDLNRKNKELKRLYSMALDANPMTGLPGNNSVAAAIAGSLRGNVPSCVIYTDLDNFKAYNDKYGFAPGDEIIKFTADVLKKSLDAGNCPDSFVGHIGGDDFVLLVPSEKTKGVVDFIIREFDAGVITYYNQGDIDQGFISSVNRLGIKENFPIMSISMAGIDLSHNRYGAYIEVNDACAGLKKKSKLMPGSSFILDKRRSED
jgi:PAS domain S-box-containing protein